MDNLEQDCALTPRQERLLAALIEAPNVEAAAKRAGVSRGSVYNWLRDPTFKAALVRRQGEVFGDALRGLKVAMAAAVSRMVGLLASKDDRLALMAAREVLATALRAHEAIDVEERLAEVEARLVDMNRMKGTP